MKRLLKKLAAIVTMAAVTLGTLSSLTLPVGAESIMNTSTYIDIGDTVDGKMKSNWDTYRSYDHYLDYKIKCDKEGTLTLSFTTEKSIFSIRLFNSLGKEVNIKECSASQGEIVNNDEYATAYWNNVTEQFVGKTKYTVSPGTYYIRFSVNSHLITNGSGKTKLATSFTSNNSSTKINYITINLPKGSTLSLGADTTGSGTVTWKSSKSSVATVSSTGKVTARAKGSTIITAKSGKSSKKIKIVVT